MTDTNKLLADDPAKAVKQVTDMVKRLLELMEKEEMALVQQDALAFNSLQDEKQKIAEQYQKAAEEFKHRLTEMRQVDKTILDNMEKAQDDLRLKTEHNMHLMNQLERMSGTKQAPADES